MLSTLTILVVVGCEAGGTVTTDDAPTSLSLSGDADLLVVGDWGSGTSSQEEVADQMADYAAPNQVAAIVTTGDNFYSDDAEALMAPFAWATNSSIPFLITWGNHDVESARRIEVIDETFDHPPRWAVHEWGPIDLVLLDSTQTDSPQQLEFLATTLADSDDPTILVFHHPPYSCGSHGNTTDIINQWVPIFDDDVVLVLSGHEHNYQRFESEEVTYVVTGGGGRSLTGLAECDSDQVDRIAGEATHNFVVLELNGTLSATAIDSDGNLVDQVTLPVTDH